MATRLAAGHTALSDDERRLLPALRAGDAGAFAEVVDGWSSSMLRVARLHVGSAAIAEEVVQDTWISVLRSLDRFEGRSAFRTWVYTILVNAARKRARSEGRSVSFSELGKAELGGADPDPREFFDAAHPRWPDCWTVPVTALPEERLLATETRRVVEGAAAELPPMQRAVFVLRDVEGWTPEEVCNTLELTGSNQRVLLHRARVRIRLALVGHFEEERS